MDSPELVINARYQVHGAPIGQGGMGVVYKAYDTITKRDVALKTMRGALNPEALQLFSKEWTVLARLSHPNIIDILDAGEFERDGERKPFFAMPLLPGATLEHLLAKAGTRLPADRVVGIAAQTCQGLQAAHEQGLIHRDLKPSNIFVMDDDTVKIIDFGVVDLAGVESWGRAQGTLQYMAPEQLERRPASPACDIFSLGVIFYQALTGRRPFARSTEAETAEAIRHYVPPPVCELNHLVSPIVSRVIQKAMAKNPWHRFPSAREFAETLQKALNGQTIERFDRAKIQPRIDRAKKAHLEGDDQFASEILTELEAEGNVDSEMTLLRTQIDQAIQQKSIRQLLDTASTRFKEEEFPLALQKIQEVLGIDPNNPEALGLRSEIEKQRVHREIENWFRLFEQHLQIRSFDQARQALEEILKLNAGDKRARELLSELQQREHEIDRLREEEKRLYESAVNGYLRGELHFALGKLQQVLDLHRQSPDSVHPERVAQCQGLYNQIRNEQEAARTAYAEARRHLAARNFSRALEVCAGFLKRTPGDPMFQALKREAEGEERQEQSAFAAEVVRRVEAESNLDHQASILQEAAERYPEEPQFQQSLRMVRERRDLVNSIVSKARECEERGQFEEALTQFDVLRSIYPQYPDIDLETDGLKQRRDEHGRQEAKRRWVEAIGQHIATGECAKARDIVHAAMVEFPGDQELSSLEQLARQSLERAAAAWECLDRGQKLCLDRKLEEGIDALRKAASLEPRNPAIRVALVDALVEKARSVMAQDWRAAESLIQEGLSIDEGHIRAKSLLGLALDHKRQKIVKECILQARELQLAGDARAALAKVEATLVSYPNEVRLAQLRSTLLNESESAAALAAAGGHTDAAVVPPPDPPQVVSDPASEKRRVTEEALQTAAANPKPEPHDSPQTVRSAAAKPIRPTENRPPAARSSFGVNRPAAAVSAAQQPVATQQRPPTRAGLALQDFLTRARTVLGVMGNELGRLRVVLQSWAEPKGLGSILQWVIIGSAAVILLLASGVNIQRQRSTVLPPPAAPVDYLVQVESNVGTAKYLIDDTPALSFPMRLKRGEHRIEAASLGYRPEVKTFTLAPDAPKPFPVSFQLSPELLRLRLSSGLKAGTVVLDGRTAGLQEGGFVHDGIALSTDHNLSLFQSGQESLAFSFRAEPGGIVTLSMPSIRTKDMNAVLIANLGSRARVYATDRSLKGGLKGEPLQPIVPEGLEFAGLTGNTEFVLDDGKGPRSVPIDFSNAPMLSVWLASDPNQVTILVDAGVPGADAIIDGKKPQPLRSGPKYFRLEPGTHTIRVVKTGYEPSEQKVELAKKGDYRKLAFNLKPVVRTASLVIEGASADAEVLIDGSTAGHVKSDGSFEQAEVPPGGHIITLRKAEFEEKRVSKTFASGQAMRLSGSEGQLTPFGGIDFHVLPRTATVSYQYADEPQAHGVENGRAVKVKAGRYTIKAIAGPNQDREEQITVEPGRIQTVGWTFVAAEAPKKTAPVTRPSISRTVTKDYFQDPETWIQDGQWSIHTSDGQSWLRSNQGAYVVEIRRQKGGLLNRTRRVEWVIDHRGSGDQIAYTFDFGSLERRVTVDGKTGKPQKRAIHGASDSYTVRIEIAPERIVIRDAQGNELDHYQRPNPEVPLGTFGFKGEVALMARSAEPR